MKGCLPFCSNFLSTFTPHHARNLQYDFRIEASGVLKSWAVPKGLSTNPKVKRLAMAVEDHPLDYANFEGVIPEGQYGGGTVMVWDRGTYEPENGEQVGALIKKGELKLKLKGKKLKGSWVLVRTRYRNSLLIKHRDHYASEDELTETSPTSVLTRRTLAEIASQEGNRCHHPQPRPSKAHQLPVSRVHL